MGMLVNGKWFDDDPLPRDGGGAFLRPDSIFRDRVTRDGTSGFTAERGRYQLVTAPSCPWAHRTVLMRKLPEFRREPRPGAFRRWLRGITVNCLRNFWRAQRSRPKATGDSEFAQMLDQMEDPDSGLSALWDVEHDRHITARLLEMIRPFFEDTTWRAFRRVALDGATPDEVAAELGVTVNAVFIAKSRVLSRLRQEGEGLID